MQGIIFKSQGIMAEKLSLSRLAMPCPAVSEITVVFTVVQGSDGHVLVPRPALL